MKVLIVDDEIYMVEYLRDLLDWGAYGFDTVLTATGGSLARDLLIRHRPELLITDVKMPRISGLDLSRLIAEGGGKTKIIIISSYSDFEYSRQALRSGVSEYLVKPIVKQDLTDTLDRIFPGKGQPERAGESLAIVEQVKAYVREHYDQALSLNILGDYVHLHPAYLSKLFKEVTGENFLSYVTEVKMEKAAELLENTDQKVYEVMKRVGYQKSQHFSSLFRKKYGMTPKEYRQMKRRHK